MIKILGLTVNSVNAWYNVHYGQAPTGDLRWRNPQPIESNNTYDPDQIIDASTPGQSCVNLLPAWFGGTVVSSIPEQPIGGEDCLLVNVYAPTKPISEKLPVVVDIHGGGYALGDARRFTGLSNIYEAFPLVNHSAGNVIVVSIQYRLGAYGWLSSEDVKSDGTGNAGFLDQRLALNWIRNHIHAFGGDGDRVTIWGGSAGGGSVATQMVLHANDPNPPFQAAISEYPGYLPFHDQPYIETQYQQLLAAADCSDLACLRCADPAALARAFQKVYVDAYAAGFYSYGEFYFGPTVDGHVLTAFPSQSFASGNFTKNVPLVVDRDGYEGVIFTNTSTSTVEQANDVWRKMFPAANDSFYEELYTLYPASDFNSTFFQASEIWGDVAITCPSRYISKAVSASGADVWKSIFRAGAELHGATAAFIFEDSVTGFNATIADWLQDWFVALALEKNPNGFGGMEGTGKPVWEKYNVDEKVLVINDTTNAIESDANWDADARCDFWGRWGSVLRV